MSEIQRWGFSGNGMTTDADGEWIRWEDAQELLKTRILPLEVIELVRACEELMRGMQTDAAYERMASAFAKVKGMVKP